MAQSNTSPTPLASELITKRIAELADWRGATLSTMRQLIHKADPEVVEEWKWMGTPVWSHDGIICTGETYKDKVNMKTCALLFLGAPSRNLPGTNKLIQHWR